MSRMFSYVRISWSERHTPTSARDPRGDVGAFGAALAARDRYPRPRPVRTAGGIAAVHKDASSPCRDRAGDVGELEPRDGYAARGSRSLVAVRLVDDDAVLGDPLKLDVPVRDVLDRAGLAVLGLDAHASKPCQYLCPPTVGRTPGVIWHTILRIDDGGVLEEDILDGIVTPTADRANGEPVTAVAHAVPEDNVLRAIVRAQTR